MTRALITIPKTARRGDVIEIRALVQHPMETGYRRSSDGDLLPRDLIRRFSCRFLDTRKADDSGTIIFAATLHAAIAANPYLSFNLLAVSTCALMFIWEGDNGFSHREQVSLTVV